MTESEPVRRRLGRYELIAEIASGGMGIVCLARAVGVGGFRRLFAIKVMHPHLVKDQQFVAMLLDEAQLAARIHHPNVVATVDICTVDDCYFLVMDYIDGFHLLDFLEHPGLTREQRIRVALRVLLDAMAGLEAAHSLQSDDGQPLGLVHRDVSPQNILIGMDGIGRLTDFGIALAASRISASRPGTIKGKPSYMAPEQARAQTVDRRADVWALGVILWEALVGTRLFVGDTEAATVLKVIDAPIESPRARDPELPQALADVCLHALERDPARRLPSARKLASELERAALSAGLLADAHEVADALRSLFAREVERRRAAIKAYAAAIGPNSLPMGPRDVYELPRLEETIKGDTLLSPLPQTPLEAASSRTAVASNMPQAKPIGPSNRAREPGSEPTMLEASAEVAAPRAPSSRFRGVLITTVVLAAASVGLWLATRGSAPATTSAPSAEPTGLASAAQKEPEVPPAATVSVAPENSAPAVSIVTAPSASAAATNEAPVPAPIRGQQTHAAKKPTGPATTSKAPASTPGPKGPVIEENPYGLR